MESANSDTRTYTAPTCSLSVTTKARSLPHLPRFDRPNSGEFTLQIDRTEAPGAEPIRLNGQLDQLDKLQQSVSQYVAQLVAKFPMGTADNGKNYFPEPEDLAPATAVVNHLYPTSGLIKNLPGLRHKSTQLVVENIPAQAPTHSNAFSAASISKLLGRSQPTSAAPIATESQVASKSALDEVNDQTGTLPRLTTGDRPLEHKLYLSDNNSGRVLTLSQSQLFDLGTTLDQYTSGVATTPLVAPQNLDVVKTPKMADLKIELPKIELPKIELPKKMAAPEVQQPKIEQPETAQLTKASSITTTSALSRLPNLPSLPAKTSSRSYDYGDESRPAFLSALPWVAAAALVVGVPFLLFGANPNLLKESMAKVKMPSDPREMFNNKKVADSSKPEQSATNPTGDGVANAATTGLPKPWEAKPVTPPPSTTTAALPGTPIPQPPGGANEIGIAPLPPSIMNIAEERASAQNPPSTTTPGVPGAAVASVPPSTPGAPGAAVASVPPSTPGVPGAAVASVPPQIKPIPSGIAPNPLSSTTPGTPTNQKQAPISGAKPSTQPSLNNPNTSLAKMPKTNKPATSVSTSVPIASAPKPNEVKKVASRNTAKVGLSQQPINLPPAFKAIGNEPLVTPPPFPAAKVDKLTPIKQQKKVVAKSKSKQVVVTKKVAKVTPQPKQPVLVPVQTADPSTIPSEFATPPGMSEINTPEIPQIISQPQLQSNNGNSNPFENPSLNETKRYFQTKWRADSTQNSTLQYVVQVNAKNGVVQSVNPQGEASTTYLKKTGVLKAGQKLLSPTTTGEKTVKIRVLLHSDGNVDALPQPDE